MRLEDTSGELRELGDLLFSLIEGLSGERPRLLGSTGWYRAQGSGSAFLYLRLIGERARKYPPNSIHLATRWDERLANERVIQGNNWYGEPSADLTVQAFKSSERGDAELFIRQAFTLLRNRSRR